MGCIYKYNGKTYSLNNIVNLLQNGEFERELTKKSNNETQYSRLTDEVGTFIPVKKQQVLRSLMRNIIRDSLFLNPNNKSILNPIRVQKTLMKNSVEAISKRVLNNVDRISSNLLNGSEAQQDLGVLLKLHKDQILNEVLNEYRSFGIDLKINELSALENQEQQNEEFTEETDLELDPTQLYIADSRSINPLDNVSNSIKLLLVNLQSTKSDISGVKPLISPKDAHDNLLSKLSNSNSLDTMIRKLQDMSETRPWAKEVINQLSLNKELTSEEKADIIALRNDFYASYHRTKVKTGNILIDGKDGVLLTEDPIRKAENSGILNYWKANNSALAVSENNNIWTTSEKTGKPSVDIAGLNASFRNNVVHNFKPFDFLSDLGIVFDNTNIKYNKNEMKRRLSGLHRSMTSLLETGADLYSLNQLSNNTGDLNYLADLYKENSEKAVNSQYTNSEGKLVYPIQLPNNVTETISTLKELREGDNIYEKLPFLNNEFASGSFYIRRAVNEYNEVTQEGVKLLSSLDVKLTEGLAVNNSGDPGSKFRALAGTDKSLVALNNLLGEKLYMSYQHADKGLNYSYNLFNGLPQSGKSINEFNDLDAQAKDMIESYVTSDFVNILENIYNDYHGTTKMYYKGYSNVAVEKDGDFISKDGTHYKLGNGSKAIYGGNLKINNKILSEISTVLAETSGESFKEDLSKFNEIVTLVNEAFKSTFVSELNKELTYLTKQLETYRIVPQGTSDYFSKNKKISNVLLLDGSSGDYRLGAISGSILNSEEADPNEASKDLLRGLNKILTAFYVNSYLGFQEQSRLFYGDPRYSKDGVDFIKRASYVSATKKLARNDVEINNQIINSEFGTRLDGRYTNPNSTFVEGREHFGKFKSQTFEEFEGITSESLPNFLENIKDDNLKPLLEKAYSNINESDGQSYVSLDAYREILLRTGNLTPELNRTYHKLANQAVKVRNGEVLTDDDLLTSKEADKFVSLKTQVSGINYDGTPIFLKHSVATYIPESMVGTNLQTLFEHMIDNTVDIVNFESAQKLGSPRDKFGKPYSYYNSEGELTLDNEIIENNYTQYIDYNLLGIQVDMSFKAKNKVTKGTQEEKLIWVNLTQNEDLNNLLNDTVKQYDTLRSEGFTRLKKDLGLSVNNGVYSITNPKALVNRFLKEAINRKAHNNIIESIKDMSNNPTMDHLVNKEQLEPILASMLDKYLIKIKFPGEAYVQQTVTGFEFKDGQRKATTDKLKSNSRLSFYEVSKKDGRTLPMQVAIPITDELVKMMQSKTGHNAFKASVNLVESLIDNSEFLQLFKNYTNVNLDNTNDYTELFANAANSIDRLNILVGAINAAYRVMSEVEFREYEIISNFYDNAMELVAYRIPTQGPNSIEHPVVGFFVSQAFGTTVICPTEMSAKSGSDFDIDKLFTYRKSYKAVNGMFRETNKVVNNIISNHIKVLSHPEMFEQLITPNSTSYFDKYMKKGGKSTYNDLLNPLFNIKSSLDYRGGALGIAIQATSSTSHSLAQSANLQFHDVITTDLEIQDPLNPMYEFNTIDLGPNSLIGVNLKPIYDSVTGHISLNNINTSGGESISTILSQLLDGFVDIAKNPWTTRLNLDETTAPIFNTMIRMGVSLDKALKVINSDIVISYTNKLRQNDSKYLNATYGKLSANNIYLTQKLETTSDKESQILKLYKQLEFVSKELLKLNNIANVDTKGMGSSITTLYERDIATEELFKSENFVMAGLDNYLYSGIHGVYAKSAMLQKGISQIFSNTTNTPNNESVLIRSYSFFRNSGNRSRSQKDKIFKRLKSDLLQYVIHKNFTLNDYLQFFDYNNHESLATTFAKYKKQGSDIFKENELLKNLVPMSIVDPVLSNSKVVTPENLSLFNKKLDADEANSIIEGWEQLYYSPNTKALATLLAKFAIMQSGSNTSNINFTEFIPSELYSEIIGELDFNLNEQDFKQFISMFYYNNSDLLGNNPKIGSFLKVKEKEILTIDGGIISYVKPWRDYQFKVYNPGAYMKISKNTLYGQKQTTNRTKETIDNKYSAPKENPLC